MSGVQAREQGAARLVAVLCLLLALAQAASSAARWIESGLFPGARAWTDPLPLAGGLLALAGLGCALWRRVSWAEAALAALALAIPLQALVELPDYASAFWYGDGPALAPLYVLLAAAGVVHALWNPLRHEFAERAAALLLLWSSANGRLFSRSTDAIFALLAAAVLLLWSQTPHTPWRAWSRTARHAALAALAFVVWALAAALCADSWQSGLQLWTRLLLGLLAASSLARVFDRERAARSLPRILAGALVGLAATLIAGWLGSDEARALYAPRVLLATRLRLLDLHPNGVGPLLASGALLALVAGVALHKRRALAGACLLLLLGAVAALALTDSRASGLGLAAGALFLLVGWLDARGEAAALGRCWQRASRAALAGAALAALVAWVWRAQLAAALDDLAQTQSALGQRWHFWRMALEVAERHPWLGTGPGQYWAHAQYALPSYYDGTAQDLHPHNLPLALAAGSGWIGLALALLALWFTWQLFLAAWRAGTCGSTRLWSAGLGATLVSVLVANALDLGQSQTTFLPLWAWFVLGLCAALQARAPDPEADATHKRWSALLLARCSAALLLVPLVGLPLAARSELERGRALLQADKPRQALEALARARALWPLDLATRALSAQAYRSANRRAEAVQELTAAAQAAPSAAAGWIELAREELAVGQAQAARAHLERARALDPLGARRGELAALLAQACFESGEFERARLELQLALDWRGASWLAQAAPAEELEPLLQANAARALALANEDEVQARRLLGALVEAWQARAELLPAIAALEAYRAQVGRPIPSLISKEIELLVAAGQSSAALALLPSELEGDDVFLASSALRALWSSSDPLLRARAQDLGTAWSDGMVNDLFYEAGILTWLQEQLAQMALVRGDFDAALLAERRALYDTRLSAQRVKSAQRFFEALLEHKQGASWSVPAFALLLECCAADPYASNNAAAMQQRLQLWLRAEPEAAGRLFDELAPAIARAGPAGVLLRAAHRALADGTAAAER